MKLSIIIVNWNTINYLRECLGSVEAAMGPFAPGTVETFVVDNCSHDGSMAMLRSEFPWVRGIENKTNVGFARANNQAFQAATAEYVLLLNPDTVVDRDALRTLVTFADAHPEAGIVGPRLLNPDGTLQTSCYPAPTLAREGWRLFHLDRLFSYGSYRMQGWRLHTSRAVDVVQGACLLLRRTAVSEAYILDEDYFIYSEEVDLCLRVQQAGRRIYWVPQAEVIHYGGQSTRQVAREMFLHLYESKVIYFRKHHGKRTAQLYKWLLSAAALPRLALGALAYLEPPVRRRPHLMLAGCYLHLLRSLSGW